MLAGSKKGAQACYEARAEAESSVDDKTVEYKAADAMQFAYGLREGAACQAAGSGRHLLA